MGSGAGDLPTKLDGFLAHLHPADKERFQLLLGTIKEKSGGALRTEIRLRHSDSSYRWFDVEGASVPNADRRSLRCVGIIRDITDAKRSQERLMLNAVHDSLTGLPNRELFLDRLTIAMERTKVEKGLQPTIFVFDIDKFKSVNSSFGLIVGDSLLLTVSRRLARNLKPQDTLARIGGDQFALLLVGQQDPREIATLAERLRLALRSPMRIAGQEIVLTGSIGIAVYDGTAADGRDLMREAEIAMYRAKRQGTDRVEIFRPEMRADKDQRIAIESDLRRAIETRQLKLLYQPIIGLSNEELVGFEALVRWEHPTLGLLSPGEFIPVAEETDLILQLGSYVLNRAVADLAHWQQELPRPEQPLFVSVNISSRQLIKPDLIQELRHVTGRAVLPRGSLRLEITESLVMENPEQATQILELLRDSGVELALDDFGTGYSSLAYLNRFPFDTIKIDKALVQASGDGENGAAIVRSVVALAHELGKKIVAEGVETPEDAAFLRSIGCQFAQGFYYGEPVGEGEVGRLLRLIRKAERRMRRRGMVRGQEKKKPLESPTHDAETAPGSASVPVSPSVPLPVAARSRVAGDTASGPPQRTPAPSGPIMRRPNAPEQTGRPNATAPPFVPPPIGARPPPVTPLQMAPPPVRQAPAPSMTSPPSRPLNPSVPVGFGREQTRPPVAPAVPGGADVRTGRKANLAALSPAVAASLAKLAGTTAAAQARRSILRPDADAGEPLPPDATLKRGPSAAE